MVIGGGMIAKRFESFRKNSQFIIFASGVSNSKGNSPIAYKREIDLLKTFTDMHKEKTLVYFSTCSVEDIEEKNSSYIMHKIQIENLIQTTCTQYYIFRISHLVGLSRNPHTILNFLFFHIQQKISFDLWRKAYRNLIDIDDAYLIIEHIMSNALLQNQIINIASPLNYKVEDIVKTIEEFQEVKGNYVLINKGTNLNISISSILPVINFLNIEFNNDYLPCLLKKFFYSMDY